MRDISFRGKRVDNGEWVYGGYYKDYCYGNTLGEKTYITVWNTFWLGFIENVQVVPETVGQYTGLKDKNGNKIFEGDIVVLSDDTVLPGYRYVISFHDGAFCIGLHDGELFGDFCSIRDGMAQAKKYDKELSICVVGKIHDNQETLS